MKSHIFRVKFKERNAGPNGGLGPPKTFKTTASCPEKAARKLRKNAIILSVRRVG